MTKSRRIGTLALNAALMLSLTLVTYSVASINARAATASGDKVDRNKDSDHGVKDGGGSCGPKGGGGGDRPGGDCKGDKKP